MNFKKNLALLSCILLAGTLSTTAKAAMSLEEIEKELMATKAQLGAVEEKTNSFNDFEFHGYARSGVIVSDERTDGDKFGIPNFAGAGAYRLGNEDDSGWEANFVKNFKMDDGSYAKFCLLLADFAGDAYDEEVGNSVQARQIFVEMGNLPAFTGAFADSAVWAGKRYYERADFHINDWKYTNMSGTGAGLTNINVGPGNLNLAFIANDLDNDDTKVYNLDARYKGLEALGGTWEYVATYKESKDSIGADDGYQLGAIYDRGDFYGLADGGSKVVVQYGDALGAKLGNADSSEDFTSDSEAFRIATSGLMTANEKWDVFAQAIYEDRSDYTDADGDETWTSFGVRPVYKVNKNFELQFELGYDVVDLDNEADGDITKLTFAPTFKLDTGNFWARPEIRTFVTYATWDDDLKDAYGTDSDDGLNFGVQAELWF